MAWTPVKTLSGMPIPMLKMVPAAAYAVGTPLAVDSGASTVRTAVGTSSTLPVKYVAAEAATAADVSASTPRLVYCLTPDVVMYGTCVGTPLLNVRYGLTATTLTPDSAEVSTGHPAQVILIEADPNDATKFYYQAINWFLTTAVI